MYIVRESYVLRIIPTNNGFVRREKTFIYVENLIVSNLHSNSRGKKSKKQTESKEKDLDINSSLGSYLVVIVFIRYGLVASVKK